MPQPHLLSRSGTFLALLVAGEEGKPMLSTNEQIKRNVIDQIHRDSRLDAEDIGVDVQDDLSVEEVY
jgi:hypothetical protein